LQHAQRFGEDVECALLEFELFGSDGEFGREAFFKRWYGHADYLGDFFSCISVFWESGFGESYELGELLFEGYGGICKVYVVEAAEGDG
jgi:hypothetical protein